MPRHSTWVLPLSAPLVFVYGSSFYQIMLLLFFSFLIFFFLYTGVQQLYIQKDFGSVEK